jgi:nitrile hydratase subunit alpha
MRVDTIHEEHHGGESDIERRTRALETLLVQKGLLTSEDIDRYLERVERDIGPMFGARVVAHAWLDPEYKRRLLTDAPAAITELGIDIGGLHLIVVESTPEVHNVVCCTLCSCYPWKLLGLPPNWYKSPAYRSRIVIDPRGVLREFSTAVPQGTAVNVWDSTSECRYMVLPERPSGTESMSESELAALVTRDAMVGVARVSASAAV